MKRKLGMNSPFAIAVPMDAVEFLDRISERRREVSLCTTYRDADKLALLKGLNIGGELLEVEDGSGDERKG
jgi:hypothetical protein